MSIGLGYFNSQDGVLTFRVMALQGKDEEVLLKEFLDMISKFDQETLVMCGHNIKEFD